MLGKEKAVKTGCLASLLRLVAWHHYYVWSYDFVFDQTEDGSRLKWLPILDEFSRDLMSLEVGRSMKAEDVIDQLDVLVEQRGVPQFIRSDNGPEFVATAVKEWIELRGFKTLFIAPGSPWQNAYSESFNSRFREEFLNVELFTSLLEAKVLGEEHRYKYNHQRPEGRPRALIAGGFNPGGICESLCFSAAASGLRSESQRHPKPRRTLIRVGSKNGGTPP